MNSEENRLIIPEWMKEENRASSLSSQQRLRSSQYLTRSIRNMQRSLSEELLTERLAKRNGFLQALDPRMKLLSTIALILLAGLTRSIFLLVGLWVFSVVLMYYSQLPILRLEKRIWGIIPLVTLLASLPALFNFINDGTPLLVIHQWHQAPEWLGIHFPPVIFISKQGAMSVLYLFLRVGISISFGALLTFSTPVNKLLKSLHFLKVPAFFVMIIEMTYRYLLLLLNISIEMFEARSLRTVGNLSLKTQRALVGSSIASLFIRSVDLTDEVYQAMTARCYTGEAVISGSMGWRKVDYLSLFVIIALVCAIMMGEHIFG
ncbi:MAG: cobalt ECF transporter T component CbiQ [Syntrophomonas sp.]